MTIPCQPITRTPPQGSSALSPSLSPPSLLPAFPLTPPSPPRPITWTRDVPFPPPPGLEIRPRLVSVTLPALAVCDPLPGALERPSLPLAINTPPYVFRTSIVGIRGRLRPCMTWVSPPTRTQYVNAAAQGFCRGVPGPSLSGEVPGVPPQSPAIWRLSVVPGAVLSLPHTFP